MAAILQTYQSQSGLTLYAHIRDKAGLIWNGSSFEAFNVANWASYSITLVEQTSSSYYKVAMPGGIAKGLYTYGVYYGSPPAAGDQLYDSQTMDWDGSQQNYVGLVVDKLPSGDISGFDPTTENVNLNSNQTGVTIGTVNNLGAAAAASVKTQIDTAIGSDAIPELSGDSRRNAHNENSSHVLVHGASEQTNFKCGNDQYLQWLGRPHRKCGSV